MEVKQSAKLVARSRNASKQQKRSQNEKKRPQPNGLLFVNFSDPAESKREDSRKAVRSFVMKKFKFLQRSSKSSNQEPMTLDEDTNDVVEETPQVSQIAENTDNSSLQIAPTTDNSSSLVADNGDDWLFQTDLADSREMEDFAMTTTKQGFPWPTLAPPEHYYNNPVSILGSGFLDPFDSYPVQIDMRGHNLVDLCTCGYV